MHILSCQPRTVFKKGKIEFDYYDKFKCIQISWSGKIYLEEYREAMYHLLETSQQLGVEYWIFDARDEEQFRLFDPEWSFHFFTKEVVKFKIKKIGRIAGGDFNHETRISDYVSSLISNHNLPYRFRYLDDLNHAISWFLEETY